MALENVLILGATSDMAIALAHTCARKGHALTLAGRNGEQLNVLASDIRIRYQVPVETAVFDALAFDTHQGFYSTLALKPGIVVCVFGLLGDQQQAQTDWKQCAAIIHSNYTGAVSILNVVANDFEQRKAGVIVGISSVAGDRGRMSNYFYGSAKAGFTAYLSGLRNRMFHSNVHVLTVKPGFVKTRMIEGMKTPGPITAMPAQVGEKIYNAIENRKNSVYVLWMWRWIMLIIRSIPESIFKKLKL